MSDFLSRLAERVLGATPPLLPLLGSRFAAPAEPADGFVEETVEGDGSAPTIRRSTDTGPRPSQPPVSVGEVASSALIPTRSPAGSRVASPVESRAAPPDESRAPSSAERRTPSADRKAPGAEGRAMASSTPPSEPEDAAPSARPSSARASEPGPSLPVRASGRVPVGGTGASRGGTERRVDTMRVRQDELPIPASAPPDPPVFSATPPQDGSSPGSSLEARGRASHDALEKREPAREPSDPASDRQHGSEALLMPVARRRGEQAAEVDQEDGARAEARQERMPAARVEKERPVVQVTIGRIEVRAVHPPAAPQPARGPGWTPPVLSLDEYLKREGGR